MCLVVIGCFLFPVLSCSNEPGNKPFDSLQYITVLGVAQDGGFPHINAHDEWADLENGKRKRELVVSLGLIDKTEQQKWLFEATPDMPQQLYMLNKEENGNSIIDGVFLTHAHIGHYTGLMHFGREAMGAKDIPVYAMPRMKDYLETNGPWSQLVQLNNITLKPMAQDSLIQLNPTLSVVPFRVPHRDEFSETVGFKIMGPHRSALFIPDINKWELWDRSIIEEVKAVDYAFLDATFFKEGEIPRPMSEVPHPFIEETVKLFENQPDSVKSKIIFIHFNHSNPALHSTDRLKDSLTNLGYHFAKTGDRYGL
ncbi:MAG: MBL fold metallo-hydrolase [Flavobacteriaceae bacterium]|nr:MBL fold metallo-hydrolase [Flavobacteriaceae bacterium]